MLYPFDLPPFAELSNAQLASLACAYCGEDSPRTRIGSIHGTPLLAHPDCAELHRLPVNAHVECAVPKCVAPAAILNPLPLCLADTIGVREAYKAENLWIAEYDEIAKNTDALLRGDAP